MIRKRTCLVLGAGASVPYGFPTGPQLRDLILAGVATPNHALRNALGLLGHSRQDLEGFANAFRGSAQGSIDAFLAHRPEFSEVGKASIAGVLIPFERPETLFASGIADNWYSYLWSHLQDGGKKSFGGNRLSIVSFNYDRSLEQFLIEAFLNTYGVEYDEAARTVRHVLGLVQVHGHLGQLSPAVSGDGQRMYSNTLDAAAIAAATSSLRVLSETTDSSDEFYAASQLIEGSDQVVFLGFGYHPPNLKRLRVDGLWAAGVDLPKLLGSGFGTTERERSRIKKDWHIDVHHDGWQNLRFLREVVDFN